MTSTLTLAGHAQLRQDIRKSRFLAHAASVETPDDALAFIARVSVGDASHNCWAYKIGALYRFNDDGEPGGSAGRPILAAIEGQGLDGVAVVVTRWFGGIKLGVGGLARAYGGCAAECLRTAEKRRRVVHRLLRVHCDFATAASLRARLREFDAVKLGEGLVGDQVELQLGVAEERLDALRVYVRDLSHGRATFKVESAEIESAPP